MKGKVKITEIARLSGVSLSTVSLVLNGKPGVSSDTRQRVLEVAQSFDYPLRADPARENSRLDTIGMVMKTDSDIPPQANPFYSKVMVGIEEVCRRSGMNLLFATLPVDENNYPVETPQLLNHPGLDGLLLLGISLESVLPLPPGKPAFPIVLVDGYSATDAYDTVVSDNFKAAYQAVKYLIDQGHRRIGLAGSEEDCYPSLRERRNGYLRALKEHEISPSYLANFNINKTKGEQEITALLQAHPQITALFCMNDDVGSAAIRSAQSLGRRVPDDLSIIGYDDTYIAANTHPALTTIHVDTVAMGQAAVQLLALRHQSPDAARMTLTVHTTLVERETVLPPSTLHSSYTS